ncbi:MAG: imidazoleglycerol-phosphate dehydratase HisB [Ruminococcaceae bacterium]|nr:imidazoleglycerol-phosphate dehydratase HisB [Oscillospiraceae bacterium]
MRSAQMTRNTAETQITLALDLDGKGRSEINTGCGFLDHMLTLFAKHAGVDLSVKCTGDTNVDYHHTTEDIGIVLGQAVSEALGEKKGICRYGYMILPMDESLILASLDVSGRSYLNYNVTIPAYKVGDFDTELVEEFWLAFCRSAACTLHIKQLEGKNTHHIIEATFKAVARAFAQAVAVDAAQPDAIPSTKGVL